MTKNKLISVILSLSDISREEYIHKFGEELLLHNPVTAVADRIARVEIVKDIWNTDHLQCGDRLSIKVFDGETYVAVIKEPYTYNELKNMSIRGSLEESAGGYVIVSVAGNRVSFSIELVEKNLLYLLGYDQQKCEHYLYKSNLDKVESPTVY